ncbi:hypothetical protein DPEC_G00243870 [Dallia pectoralis]|uniref:Uncharacterized protein n=1 Tax=Dallia pectoralis TaxID=75939 RepID=A0ACC2FVN7_DALPE|nr:hypothetical protein DPEC_G00243870 [Dallia pectoralis]
MLAARSSGGGVGGPGVHNGPPGHRKQSVASMSGSKARGNSQERCTSTSVQQAAAPQRNKAALVREMETQWYLRMCGLGREESVAQRTGMPYRKNAQGIREMYLYKATCSDIPNPKQKGCPKQVDRGPGDQALHGSVICKQSLVGAKMCPVMLWGAYRANTQLEVKRLEEFLNVHAVSVHDTVRNQTGMVYR